MKFAPRDSILLILTAISQARGAGVWTDETIEVDGLTRTYKKYVPNAFDASAGLMMFFHGAGGSSEVRSEYDVEKWSEHFGFLGIVPDGSPERTRGRKSSYVWNIEDLTGVDEVSFIQDIRAKDVHAADVTAMGGPEIALGFSNGAGMSSLMCCYDSTDLYVAHVGCHIDPAAEFTAECGGGVVTGKGRRGLRSSSRRLASASVSTWNGVGDGDFFLLDGTEGLFSQFASRTCDGTAVCSGQSCMDGTSCPLGSCIENDLLDSNTSPSFTCFDDPDCDEAGQLCLYDDLGHAIDPGMTATAWSYLTSNTLTYSTGSSGGPGPGCQTEGNCKDAVCCEGYTCKRVKGSLECVAA